MLFLMIILPIVWLIGSVVGARLALTARLESPVCTNKRGRHSTAECRRYHNARCGQPRGYLNGRTLTDALIAAGLGLLTWPALILAAAVARAVPETGGEVRRRLEQQDETIERQQADIARLADQLDEARAQ